MKKLIAFACDTPIQVLNAMNLKETYYKDFESDIYIYNQFNSASRIYDRLLKNGMFSNVFLINPFRKYSSTVQKVVTIKRMAFPYGVLSKYCTQKKVIRKRYDVIAFSFITPFTISLFGVAKASEFILLEDGIGTYVNNILDDYTSSIFKKIAAHTYYGNIFVPEKIAVYNPDMLKRHNVTVLKLESNFSYDLREKTEFVFGYQDNMFYKDNKIVYLTQPLQENKEFSAEKAEKIIQVLRKSKDNIVIRVHPRDNEDYYKEFSRDLVNNLWELECIHQISDESILIGGYSTTQFMPKILKNTEPYIIFLYKLLFDNLESTYWKNTEIFIEKFRNSYSHPNKIIIPQSVDELEEVLDKIRKEEI